MTGMLERFQPGRKPLSFIIYIYIDEQIQDQNGKIIVGKRNKTKMMVVRSKPCHDDANLTEGHDQRRVCLRFLKIENGDGDTSFLL